MSNQVHAQPQPFATIDDPAGTSLLFASFGQFLTHDITFRAKAHKPRFLRARADDPSFSEGTLIPYAPNAPHPETGEPYNQVTSWIDASMVYGSDRVRAASLRSFDKGRLRTSPGAQLPIYGLDHGAALCRRPDDALFAASSLQPIANENPRHEPPSSLFLAGDERANENPLLLSLHTIFVREHNRYVDALAHRHPNWSDERLYQEGRRWTSGIIQAITYEEYLPLLLGAEALPPYRGYRPDRATALPVEMVAAALRMGHSQMGPRLHRVAPDGGDFVRSGVSLKAAFFATPLYRQEGGGPASWLLGAARTRAQAIDLVVIDDLRNYMFGNLMGGLDIGAINIAVGRETLAGSYSDLRTAVGLEPLRDFADLAADADVTARLQQLYGTVDRLDPWVALLAETSGMDGGLLGPTAHAILVDSFTRLRDGDRFFYEGDPAVSAFRTELKSTRLSHVIRRNLEPPWDRSEVPEEVFRAHPSEFRDPRIGLTRKRE